MRLSKTYKGEMYFFNVQICNYGTRECIVRPLHTNQEIKAVISEDAKLIELSEPIKVQSYDRNSSELLYKIKINKDYQKQVKNDFKEWKN